MKHILTAIVILACHVAAAAQTEKPDTIRVIENASQLQVTTSGNHTTISAVTVDQEGNPLEYKYDISVEQAPRDEKADTWHFDFPFKSNGNCVCGDKVSRDITGLKGLYWGWNFNYGDKGSIKNCFEAGIFEAVGVSWQRGQNGPSFDIGLGFGMRRYLGGDGMKFARHGRTLMLVPGEEPDGAKLTRARMDIWTFHLPVTYTQPIGRKVDFVAGVLVNFNTYTKAWNRWEHGEETFSETLKGFDQRLLTADIFGCISLKDAIGFYARWSPVPVFVSDKGPSLRSWSIGVTIGF